MDSSFPGTWMSVRIGPGETALTRMPSGPTSRARPFVRLSIPPLEAAYQTCSPTEPYSAAREEISTMDPPLPLRRVDMRRTASREQINAPVRFTSTTDCSVALLASISEEDGPVMPPL